VTAAQPEAYLRRFNRETQALLNRFPKPILSTSTLRWRRQTEGYVAMSILIRSLKRMLAQPATQISTLKYCAYGL
jgi:hypothetical protein